MQIIAGGGVVTFSDFLVGGCFASVFSVLFVLSGRGLLYPLNLFQQKKINYFGYYYFMGLSSYLILVKLAAKAGFAFNTTMWIASIILFVISFIPIGTTSFKTFFSTFARYAFWSFSIGLLALFLLNIIAKSRGGPMYAEYAEYIITTNSLPLLNRHHGQSILAATILTIFDTQNLQLSRMGVNLWLPISQVFLLFVVYSLAEKICITKLSRLMVCLVAFAGNCALSLLPQIPSDHDFPLIFNVYADSVIGLGSSMLIALVSLKLIDNKQHRNYILYSGCIIYILFTALNITAELNIPINAISLTLVFMIAIWKKRNFKAISVPLFFLTITAAALASSSFMGGIYMPKNLVSRVSDTSHNQALFDDSNADSSKKTITATHFEHWYLPYVTPGFYKNFGNYESLYDASSLQENSLNDFILKSSIISQRPLSSSIIAKVIYIIEMRINTILRILFWPILACIYCVWSLSSKESNYGIRIKSNSNEDFLDSNWGMIFSISTFLIGLSVILLNTNPGQALFWKWALTRLNEVGNFVMMIYVGIFLTKILDGFKLKREWIRILSAIVLITLLTSGVLIRVLIYSGFDG